MSRAEPADQDRCTHCDNALRKVPCQACNAKGFIRRWLFFKDECWICSGNGFRLRCADELSHGLGWVLPARQEDGHGRRSWFLHRYELWHPASPRYGSTQPR